MRLTLCSTWQCDRCLQDGLSLTAQPPEGWQTCTVLLNDKHFESQLCGLCRDLQLEPKIAIRDNKLRVKWKKKGCVA